MAMNREAAAKATKAGAIAAVISGVITLAIVGIAVSTNADGEIGFFNDPLYFFDAAFLFACAFGVYKKSRVTAVILLGYFLLSKLLFVQGTGNYGGMALSLVFIFFFANAVRGAFAWHRLEKQDNPDYRSGSRWWLWLAVPVVAIVTLLMGLTLSDALGFTPPVDVVTGDQLAGRIKRQLVDANVIEESERIDFFYSDAPWSVMADGNLLTDQRVISYFTNESGEFEVYELFLDEVASVQLIEEGSFWESSIYQVNGYPDDNWFQLYLSPADSGDRKFIEALQQRIGQPSE